MWPRFRPAILVLALGFVPACQRSHTDTSPFTTTLAMTSSPASTGAADSSTGDHGSSTGSTGSSSTTELSTSSGESGEASSSGTTLILDVGTNQDLGDPKPPGCKGKIDFLFVISRQSGMSYFQTQLLAAFPHFIDTIQAKFADFDYHIMVVDGDPTWGSDTCDAQCPMPCPVPGYPCGYTPTSCDTTLGAGTVFPAGYDAPNKPCPIDGNRRYIIKGETKLNDTFACVAQVGSSGRAWIGEALTAAVLPALNKPGSCNEGFLREDALLMVTLISNTFDYGPKPWGSKGSPGDWAAAVLQAKHDDPESVVMFSILHSGEPECDPDDRTCQMVKMFPHHLLVDREEPDYGPFFEQATDLVEVACADFVPPG